MKGAYRRVQRHTAERLHRRRFTGSRRREQAGRRLIKKQQSRGTLWTENNALALLAPESQEEEIESFVADLRRMIAMAQKKAGIDPRPN